MDALAAWRLAALRLQAEWGADEALADAPIDRLGPAAPPASRPSSSERAAIPPSSPARALAGAAARAAEAAAAADSLDALEAAVAAFDGCALRDTAANLVFADGDPASALMLIGDAPAEDEDRAGRPFAGAAGAYLDRMLGSIGLGRGAVRIGMLVPWRPPGGRPANPSEIACCVPFLLRHIALVRPRRLLLFGPATSRALLPPTAGGRRPARGEWLGLDVPGLPLPIPALPTASPAALLARPSERRRAWADLRLTKRAIEADLTKK